MEREMNLEKVRKYYWEIKEKVRENKDKLKEDSYTEFCLCEEDRYPDFSSAVICYMYASYYDNPHLSIDFYDEKGKSGIKVKLRNEEEMKDQGATSSDEQKILDELYKKKIEDKWEIGAHLMFRANLIATEYRYMLTKLMMRDLEDFNYNNFLIFGHDNSKVLVEDGWYLGSELYNQ